MNKQDNLTAKQVIEKIKGLFPNKFNEAALFSIEFEDKIKAICEDKTLKSELLLVVSWFWLAEPDKQELIGKVEGLYSLIGYAKNLDDCYNKTKESFRSKFTTDFIKDDRVDTMRYMIDCCRQEKKGCKHFKKDRG